MNVYYIEGLDLDGFARYTVWVYDEDDGKATHRITYARPWTDVTWERPRHIISWPR